MKWINKLKQGLKKTRKSITDNIERVIRSRDRIDEKLLEEIEEILVTGDIGINEATSIIDSLKEKVKKDGIENPAELFDLLKDELIARLNSSQGELILNKDGPTVILVVGVNGSGKTTTIAKLAQKFRKSGKNKLTFAAADTFRAAAIEQLEIWAKRVGADLIKHKLGADPSAVAYDALEHVIKGKHDVLFIDTAGRLQTRHNLMEELKKINRTIEKKLGREADERLLILDATTGQNAISQARLFNQAIPLTGIIITKLDSTAKGGALIPIASQLKIPIKLIGVGEKEEDLHEFNREEFVEALL